MKSLRKSVVLVVLVVTSSTLLAQPSPPTPDPTPPTPDQNKPINDQGEIDIALNIPVADMQTRAAEALKTSQEHHDSVVKMQLVARKDKDAIRLNCLNDLLLQIRALLNIIEGAIYEFDAAISSADETGRNEQYTKVMTSAESVRQHREAANACAGELEPMTDSLNTYDGPDIPDDPGDDLFPDGVEDPGYASPVN